MDMQAPNVYAAAIPGIPELGMVWMGDMMVHGEPTHELMLDPRHAESPFFPHGSHSFEDLRNHQLQPTTMVRYLPQQFHGECSEPDEAMEAVDVQEMHHEYDPQTESTEMTEYLTLEDYMTEEDREQVVNNAATQTQDNRNRKIKPIKHPGLVLKTPIAYQPHTDLNFIPIRKDGIAVCEKCGAIGVKHAFYTKERRFCSRACARSSEHTAPAADSTYSPSHPIESLAIATPPSPEEIKPIGEELSKRIETERKEPEKKEKEVVKSEPVMPEDLPVRRKRTAEMDGSYDWTPQLIEHGFCAAPVSCFKHAPISEIWDDITVGMKVEVENTDCDEVCEAFPDSFWVATVLRISGYRALLRYEGFGHNAEKDFWVSLCSNDIHPVGWCATIGKPLIPPNTIANKYKDWKDFLKRRLTGARTLPTDFYNKVNDSMKSRFRCGLQLEVVDKNRISQVKVATIQKIVGKRLHVRYYDSPPEDNGFWCHEDSPLIHPVGWSRKIGQTLDAYPEYLDRISKKQFSDDDATDDIFFVPKNHMIPGCKFQEGMKIEAIDPLNLSAICAATVMRVLRKDFIMIRIDSYDEDSSGADWFCYHSCSPCIFPVGFCAQHGLPLTPPKGYDPTTFTWDSYLTETNTVPAPMHLFNQDVPQQGFIEGMRLEAADLMDPRLVCVATITRVIGRLLRVHFDGWEDEYDQWLDCQSPDIYPVGWCDLVDHKLEGPRVINKTTSPTVKSPRGLKRKTKRKMKRSGKLHCGRQFLPRHSERINPTRERDRERERKQELELEPAQGIKIERDHELESLPEQASREPEPAEEPAGPDQTLPSPSSCQGQILIETQNNLQFAPPSRERNVTLCVNNSEVSEKYIPRLADCLQKSSDAKGLVPSEWNIFDVAQFLRVNDCATYCDNFSKRKVDGKTLLNLTKDQIIDLTGFKVGPSLKIYDLIQQLKIKVNPAQERLKLGLKKLF